MTETMVRTYTVGERPDDYAWRPTESSVWCREPVPGSNGNNYVCSIRRGHEGPQHVAAVSGGVVAVKDREPSEEPSEEPVGELAAFRERVRQLAQTICANRGYGTWESWNATMVQLGLAPFEERKVRVVVPVSQVAAELGAGVDEAGAQEWLDGRRHRLADYLHPVAEDLGEPRIEVTAETPGVDGVEPLPHADTDDLATYQRLVRRVAIDKAADESWCDDGLNGVLSELGLDPKSREYTVEVRVRAYQTVQITVTARNEEGALDQVDRYDIRDRIDSSEWEWDGDWDSDDMTVTED